MNDMMWTRLQRIVAIAVMVAVLAPAAAAQTAPAGAGEPGLVIEALRVLQTNYVDQVDTPKLLNAATEALRKALSAAGVTVALETIPPGLSEAEARRIFTAQFTTAASAGAPLTATQLSYAAIRGMAESFNDSHVGFLTPEANRERVSRQRGQAGFTGAGLIIRALEGKIYVTSVIPGSPAEQAGVRDFDRILRIDSTTTEGMDVSQVSGLIRGLNGTPVTLTLQRGGALTPIVLTITRGPIVIPSIFRAELLDGGIGYIRLSQFAERTGTEFREALSRLLDRGMRALIIDLRGNSGGFLQELNIVLNSVLPKGVPVYSERRRGGQERTITTTAAPLLPATMPLTVVVDEGSASASELFSAAVQENRRGQLVGGKTAGAVEASILITLSDGSALSVTISRLATGRGIRLEGAGVTPDVEAVMTAADFDAGTDRPLGTAIRIVRQILALPAGQR